MPSIERPSSPNLNSISENFVKGMSAANTAIPKALKEARHTVFLENGAAASTEIAVSTRSEKNMKTAFKLVSLLGKTFTAVNPIIIATGLCIGFARCLGARGYNKKEIFFNVLHQKHSNFKNSAPETKHIALQEMKILIKQVVDDEDIPGVVKLSATERRNILKTLEGFQKILESENVEDIEKWDCRCILTRAERLHDIDAGLKTALQLQRNNIFFDNLNTRHLNFKKSTTPEKRQIALQEMKELIQQVVDNQKIRGVGRLKAREKKDILEKLEGFRTILKSKNEEDIEKLPCRDLKQNARKEYNAAAQELSEQLTALANDPEAMQAMTFEDFNIIRHINFSVSECNVTGFLSADNLFSRLGTIEDEMEKNSEKINNSEKIHTQKILGALKEENEMLKILGSINILVGELSLGSDKAQQYKSLEKNCLVRIESLFGKFEPNARDQFIKKFFPKEGSSYVYVSGVVWQKKDT